MEKTKWESLWSKLLTNFRALTTEKVIEFSMEHLFFVPGEIKINYIYVQSSVGVFKTAQKVLQLKEILLIN